MVLGFILSLEKDKNIKTQKNYARINPQQRQSQMVALVIIARVKTSENEPSNQNICTTPLDDQGGYPGLLKCRKNVINGMYNFNPLLRCRIHGLYHSFGKPS